MFLFSGTETDRKDSHPEIFHRRWRQVGWRLYFPLQTLLHKVSSLFSCRISCSRLSLQHNNDNNNNNQIEMHTSRFFAISSLCRKLSPTHTLKWPWRNHVQTTCNTQSAHHVQRVVCHLVQRDSSAIKVGRGGGFFNFFLRSPAISLGFTTFWVRFVRMWPFFNPTIKVVTFRLRGWCVLGGFLLPAFTCLEHEHQDLLSLCDEMHVCTD